MKIKVQFDDKPFVSFLKNSIITPARYRELQNELGGAMVSLTRQNFLTQKAPDGVPWQPSYRAKTQGGQTLRDTGVLMNSLTFVPVSNGIIYGTNVIYGKTLHYGATITAKNGGFLRFMGEQGFIYKKSVAIPARPFLGIGDKEKSAIFEILQEFL